MAQGWTYGVDGSGEPRSRGNRRVNHARRICKRMAAVLPTALWRIVLVCVVLFGYLAVAPGSAAARLLTVSEYGRDVGSATAVSDALKSQVFYGRLGTGGSALFRHGFATRRAVASGRADSGRVLVRAVAGGDGAGAGA